MKKNNKISILHTYVWPFVSKTHKRQYGWVDKSRVEGRSENSMGGGEAISNLIGNNLSPLVEIGLTDRSIAPPHLAHPGSDSLEKELEMMLVKREHVSDFTVSSWPKNQWDGVLKKTRTFLVFFQSTKGSLKHKVSLSFDLDHTSSIGNLILDGSTLLALALQNPMTDLKKSFCFSIRQYSSRPY